MRKYTLLLAFIAICLSTSAATPVDQAWVERNYTKQEREIPMRDGVKLYTAIYSPIDNSEAHPILITRTPYNCAPYGKEFASRLWKSHFREYLKEGYILVFQDVRGRWMSEGEWVDVRPFIQDKTKGGIDEASDSYDTVDWLLKNIAGNNGNVGFIGSSYPGFYAFMGAASGHPAVKAASPQAPVTDWYMGDDIHHNGALALCDAFGFIGSIGRYRPAPTQSIIRSNDYKASDKNIYDYFLKKGNIASLSEIMRGDSVRFWNDIVSHPDYDEWWQSRDARNACRNIAPALLIVGGTFDAEDCYGAWNLYYAVRKSSPKTECRLIIGPWAHGAWNSTGKSNKLGNVTFSDESLSAYYQNQIEVPFFNHYLKGKGDIKSLAGAEVFFSGENRWRKFDKWAPSSSRTFYLVADNSLGLTKPKNKEEYFAYTSDPSKPVPYKSDIKQSREKEYMTSDQMFASERRDVATYSTGVLTKDMTVGGAIKVSLNVAISTTDADFVVKVLDVAPDSTSMMIRGDIMRGRYRKSFTLPEAFTPGKVERVEFVMPDVAHTLLKGHRMVVQVQSSWFPLFDRNPQQMINIYTCKPTDYIPCDVKIYGTSSITFSNMK